MSNNFDPFSGSGGSYSYTDEKKKPNNKLITVVLVILLIGFGIYYAVNFLFLNNVDVSFNVRNTEGDPVSAVIRISTDPLVSNVKETVSSSETVTLRKREYYYSVQAAGYAPFRGDLFLKNSGNTESKDVVLEKNISLKIDNISFPEKLYAGQTAILIIGYENTSTNTTYTLEDLVIEGDVEDWDFVAVDPFYDPIDKSQVQMFPKTKSNLHLRFIVKDTGKTNNKISVRVKYKHESRSRNFEIIEEPNVPITGDIKGNIESGESKNYNITINNSRNRVAIPDLSITIDVNGSFNENVSSWFRYPEGNILIDSSKNETKTITVTVPQTAREDKIEGNLILNSSMFKDPRLVPISLNVNEPNINFSTSINRNNIKLKYDVNKSITDVHYLLLTLDNRSTIDLDIIRIDILDIDSDDCDNYIFISPNALPSMRVNRNTKPEVPIKIEAIDTGLVGSLINNIRMCNIIVEYKHPFRPEESVIISNNISIAVEE